MQNGNAYEEGLLEFWDPIKKYWADPYQKIASSSSIPGRCGKSTRWQYENGVEDKTLLDPTHLGSRSVSVLIARETGTSRWT